MLIGSGKASVRGRVTREAVWAPASYTQLVSLAQRPHQMQDNEVQGTVVGGSFRAWPPATTTTHATQTSFKCLHFLKVQRCLKGKQVNSLAMVALSKNILENKAGHTPTGAGSRGQATSPAL